MKNIKFILIVLLLSIGAVLPFFNSGVFPIHDNTQNARVFEMGKSLLDGMFPVRWVSDLGYGYGYPIFNFYAPLVYYFGGTFILLGINVILATKLMMIIGILASGITMYFLAKEVWGEWGGIISGLFYIYAPYHAIDVYVRGDVAEFWAYAFIPLIFYGLIKLYKEKTFKYVIITSISFAGIIISHNLTALMVFPFILITSLILTWQQVKKKNRISSFYPLIALIIGALISSFYSLPVFLEMKYTNVISQIGGGADFRDHFVCLDQFWYSPWGFGGSAKGCSDGLSFMIGKLPIITSVISIIIMFIIWNRKKTFQKFSIIAGLLGLIISILFALQISQPIWEIIKPMAFLQYPWRFLILISFFASFLSGSIVWYIEKRLSVINFLIFFVLITASILFFQIKFFSPQTIYSISPNTYTDPAVLKWQVSRISDEYMPPGFQKPKNENEVENSLIKSSNGLKIKILQNKTQEKKLDLFLSGSKNVLINIAYFPGWVATLDNKRIPLVETKSGMSAYIPSGQHVLDLKFKQTPSEILGDVLSFAGVVMLILGIIVHKKYLHEKSIS